MVRTRAQADASDAPAYSIHRRRHQLYYSDDQQNVQPDRRLQGSAGKRALMHDSVGEREARWTRCGLSEGCPFGLNRER